MITRYNTNRDATRQVIGASILVILVLLIAPPAMIFTAPSPPTESGVTTLYAFFYGCVLLLIIYCVYRYYHWSHHDDTCLLSAKTLAILRRGSPVRFVKPHDIVALRRDGMRLTLTDGSLLRIPHLPANPGETALPHALVTTWYGKEFLDNAERAHRDALRPSARAITAGIVLVALVLLVALALALAGLWREFARFSYGAFIAGNVMGGIYMYFHLYRAGKVVCPVPVPSAPSVEAAIQRDAGHSRYSGVPVEIRRYPEERPRAVEHAGMAILVLIGLCVFIPMCRMALSFDAIEQSTRALILLIAFDLTLVALYTLWRFYQNIIRGDIFVTVLLSPRTIAVLRPRKPVRFIKPFECAALVCGRNELALHDGRVLALAKDIRTDEERTVCKALCQQWWRDAYAGEPNGIWASISMRCRRQIIIGICIALVGFAILMPCPGPWGTAIAHHFILPGGILAVYGYWTGLRGYGRTIHLGSPKMERDAHG